MRVQIPAQVRADAITANLTALRRLLAEVAERSDEAHQLAQRREFNAAIGSILDLDNTLDQARSLYSATLTLHRIDPSDAG